MEFSVLVYGDIEYFEPGHTAGQIGIRLPGAGRGPGRGADARSRVKNQSRTAITTARARGRPHITASITRSRPAAGDAGETLTALAPSTQTGRASGPATGDGQAVWASGLASTDIDATTNRVDLSVPKSS